MGARPYGVIDTKSSVATGRGSESNLKERGERASTRSP